MGDYFTHWLNMGKKLPEPPRIFGVNWFRTDEQGKFIWPGFSDNMRILKWIVDRVHGRVGASQTPVGWMPKFEDIVWDGLDFGRNEYEVISDIDSKTWQGELDGHKEWFDKLGGKLPKQLELQRQLLQLNFQ